MIASVGLGSRSRKMTGVEKEPQPSPATPPPERAGSSGCVHPWPEGAVGSAVNPHSLASRLEASSPAHPAHGEKSRCADHTATHHGAGERQRVTRRDEGPPPARLLQLRVL